MKTGMMEGQLLLGSNIVVWESSKALAGHTYATKTGRRFTRRGGLGQ